MSRQHINIGSVANDGTGDVPRVAFDKVNDNFIELYDLFDELPEDFWPLTGTADLTGDVTIDGNNFDLIFGSTNPLDDFEVYTDNGIYLEVESGLNNSYIDMGSNFVDIYSTDGTDESDIFIDPDVIAFVTVGIFSLSVDDGAAGESSIYLTTSSQVFSVSDGVDTSSITLGPDTSDIVSSIINLTSGDPLFGPGGGFSSTETTSSMIVTDSLGGTAQFLIEDDLNISLICDSLSLDNDLFSTDGGVNYLTVFNISGTEYRIPCQLITGGTGRVIRRVLWYDNQIDNSAGGTPLNTNSDYDVFGSEPDAYATILFSISSIASDGSEGGGGTILATVRRDGSSNPTFNAENPTFQFENGEATATVTTNGANVRLTITTPTGEAYRWTVWADINLTTYT